MAFVFFFSLFFSARSMIVFYSFIWCAPPIFLSLLLFLLLFCFYFVLSALLLLRWWSRPNLFFFCFACFGFFLYVFFSGFLYLPIPLILFVLRDKWREYDIHAKSGHWHNYFVITIINFTKRGCPSSASLKGLAHRPLISKVGCAPCELLQERKLWCFSCKKDVPAPFTSAFSLLQDENPLIHIFLFFFFFFKSGASKCYPPLVEADSLNSSTYRIRVEDINSWNTSWWSKNQNSKLYLKKETKAHSLSLFFFFLKNTDRSIGC